mgnify:FL=1
MISKQVGLNVILYLLAVLAAYSRVYLSQHFVEDTIAGSWLGIISAILCYFIFVNSGLSKAQRLDQPLFNKLML